jgi:hypothetical protein
MLSLSLLLHIEIAEATDLADSCYDMKAPQLCREIYSIRQEMLMACSVMRSL